MVRSLRATWETLRFRLADPPATRTQKLELLREKVASGGGGSIATLTDVDYVPAPADGYVLIYDDASNTWIPGPLPGGGGGGTIYPADLPYVTPEQYGAAADFVTDDTAAFVAAEAAAVALGKYVALKGARYYLANGFNAHKGVYWQGCGGNAALNGGGTLIRVGKNVNGWVANYGSTHGDGLGTQGSAEAGKIEGIAFYGGNVNVNGAGVITSFGAGDSQTGHGVRIRTPFYGVSDVLCAFFGGDALNINASNGGADSVTGNANNFTVDRFHGIYCGGYAILTNGLDANSGSITNSSAISCCGGGFIEYSFLGNNYFGLHVRACGVETNILGYDAPTGTCTYLGNVYRVMPGKTVEASTTTPGTDPTVWAITGAFSNRPWVSGKTWAIGAPFATNPANVNGCSFVAGLYTEDSMMPVAATVPTMIFGGLHGNSGFIGNGTDVSGTSDGGLAAGNFLSLNRSDFTNSSTFGDPLGNAIFKHTRGTGGSSTSRLIGYSFVGKQSLGLELDNSFMALTVGLEATHPYGYGSVTIGNFWLGRGDVNGAIPMQARNAAPTTGAWPRGSIVFNDQVAAGSNVGWVCIAAGTPGTWKPWGQVAPIHTTQSAGYTETETFGEIFRRHDNAAGYTVIMPTAAGNTAKYYHKKIQGGGTITIDGAGAETIEGAATYALTAAGESVTLKANPDGSGWEIY